MTLNSASCEFIRARLFDIWGFSTQRVSFFSKYTLGNLQRACLGEISVGRLAHFARVAVPDIEIHFILGSFTVPLDSGRHLSVTMQLGTSK